MRGEGSWRWVRVRGCGARGRSLVVDGLEYRRWVTAMSPMVLAEVFPEILGQSCNACRGMADMTIEPGGCPDPRADSHQAYSFLEGDGAVI